MPIHPFGPLVVRLQSIALALTFSLGVSATAAAGCGPDDVIDDTTADSTSQRLEEAGYEDVSNLRKGCDNFWHAEAKKDGETVFVVVTPEGEIREEGG